MLTRDIDAHVHFIHSYNEVVSLERAAIPMAEYIAAVAKSGEKTKLKLITGCQYFRVRDARIVRDMLLRACKYAKAHLSDYFPGMRDQILLNAETLENVTNFYWDDFQRLKEETIPVH
jgi:Iap family predicted aminopeptidase